MIFVPILIVSACRAGDHGSAHTFSQGFALLAEKLAHILVMGFSRNLSSLVLVLAHNCCVPDIHCYSNRDPEQ